MKKSAAAAEVEMKNVSLDFTESVEACTKIYHFN
jgi:hypothetical protein